MYKIIQKRKYFTIVSSVLVVTAIALYFIWGLQLGIDFTGGSRLEVSFTGQVPELEEINNALVPLELGEIRTQPADQQGVILKLKDITNEQRQSVLATLEEIALEGVTELSFTTIGPSIGIELRQKAYWALLFVVLAIIIYITWAFRKISRGGSVPSWVFGTSAVIALIHDVIIIIGLYVVLGKVFGTEVDTLFVTALLTVLGFSVHDTIVVFDRIREGVRKYSDQSYEEIVNRSINETLARSINTSLTTLFVLIMLAVLGGESIKMFVIALIAGIVVGTYSSIYIASPFLVYWNNWRIRRINRT